MLCVKSGGAVKMRGDCEKEPKRTGNAPTHVLLDMRSHDTQDFYLRTITYHMVSVA